jgi:hypothetical protein
MLEEQSAKLYFINSFATALLPPGPCSSEKEKHILPKFSRLKSQSSWSTHPCRHMYTYMPSMHAAISPGNDHGHL